MGKGSRSVSFIESLSLSWRVLYRKVPLHPSKRKHLTHSLNYSLKQQSESQLHIPATRSSQIMQTHDGFFYCQTSKTQKLNPLSNWETATQLGDLLTLSQYQTSKRTNLNLENNQTAAGLSRYQTSKRIYSGTSLIQVVWF